MIEKIPSKLPNVRYWPNRIETLAGDVEILTRKINEMVEGLNVLVRRQETEDQIDNLRFP